MRFISSLTLTLCLFLCSFTACFAQNWDEVRNSSLYYYGEGIADTEAEADKMALAALSSMIATQVSNRRYSDVTDCFTLDGLEIFNKLVAYGRGRIVSEPTLHYFKSTGGTVVVRGLQMSFAFTKGVDKRTFVEDVAFTFDTDGKISNVAFGLGKNVENEVLGLANNKDAFNWDDEFCELFMEFLENYKTAYDKARRTCLEGTTLSKCIWSRHKVLPSRQCPNCLTYRALRTRFLD